MERHWNGIANPLIAFSGPEAFQAVIRRGGILFNIRMIKTHAIWNLLKKYTEQTSLSNKNLRYPQWRLSWGHDNSRLFGSTTQTHDDVIKWKHLPCYWPIVRGIHRSPVDSSRKGQWRGLLKLYLICAWTNGWANNRNADDLWRHCSYFDVSAMYSRAREYVKLKHMQTNIYHSYIIIYHLYLTFIYILFIYDVYLCQSRLSRNSRFPGILFACMLTGNCNRISILHTVSRWNCWLTGKVEGLNVWEGNKILWG